MLEYKNLREQKCLNTTKELFQYAKHYAKEKLYVLGNLSLEASAYKYVVAQLVSSRKLWPNPTSPWQHSFLCIQAQLQA